MVAGPDDDGILAATRDLCLRSGAREGPGGRPRGRPLSPDDEPQVPDGVEVVGMVSRQGHDQSEHRSRHGAAQAQSCPQRTPNQASAATERPVEAMNPERTM